MKRLFDIGPAILILILIASGYIATKDARGKFIGNTKPYIADEQK